VTNDDSKPRRYSEEEFALILRRASEIQETPGKEGTKNRTSGMTLEEMQSIAREVGIDPEAVTRAASVLGTMEWGEKAGLAAAILGGPSKYHLDCEVPGRLPPEEMGRVLEVIRRVAEHQGDASEVLGGVEWKTVGDLNALNVNVSPRGNRTSIQIVGDRSAAGALSFTFPMAAAAVLIGGLGAVFEPTTFAGISALITGLLGSGFMVSRTLWSRGSKKFRTRMTKLMEAVSHSVEEVAVPPWLEQGALPPERSPGGNTLAPSTVYTEGQPRPGQGGSSEDEG